MSVLIYLASDAPFLELKNPHYQALSVNEALARGVEVPDFLLEDETDRDKPDVVLWSDIDLVIDGDELEDGGLDDDLAILPIEKSEDILTEKQYCAMLEWHKYTPGRAERVISYIREHLKHTPEVEIWHIWMGAAYPPPQIKRLRFSADALDVHVIEQLDALDVCSTTLAAGSWHLPKDWEATEEEMEISMQYCFEIVRN